jgi:lysophospholipase L1-like esterase
MSLGRKDVIVVNGGLNDIGNNNTKRNGILVMMTQFMQKYNTNIIVVNIPYRHNLAKDSKANFEIQAFNAKVSKIAKSFRLVALVEMHFNREHFIKHSLHLNNAGKEGLAKLSASKIDKLINNINKI